MYRRLGRQIQTKIFGIISFYFVLNQKAKNTVSHLNVSKKLQFMGGLIIMKGLTYRS